MIALLTRELISNMFPSENKTISFLPLCCAALYLFNGNIHWYLFSGMETLLFHFLSLASIYLYSRQGFTMRTGLVLGLLLLTRVSEAPLIAAIGIVDFLRKKKDYAGYGGILLVYLPYLLFSYHLTGSLLPTTAQGKTLTLVDGQFRPLRMISFLFACLRYFFLYNPQILLLLIFVAIFFGWRLLMALKGRKEVNISERVEEHYLFWVIVFWGVFHLGIYTVTFRAMTHHLRYVSGIYPVIILLSGFCWSQWTLRRKGMEKALPILFMTAVLLLTVVNIGFWKEVYYGNV
ncbi:MAG: hypothetical protein JW950_02840, partial [Deltaproteobacteria bacterium]|nr:hypothetical protein [Deltaproteobacteria bacterium]